MSDISTDQYVMENGVGGLKGLPSVSKLLELSYGQLLADRDFYRMFMPSDRLMLQYTPSAIEDYGVLAGESGYGNSKYDKNIINANQFDDINEIRAEAQSPAAKIFNGFGKFVGTFGTTFIDTILTPVVGLGQGLINLADEDKSFIEGFWNNPINRAMSSLLEDFEKWMPNYYTEREQQRDWYQNIFTANFWGDKVLKNAGFTAGAMAAMALTGGLTGGIAGGLIQGTGKAIGGLAKGLGATRNTLAAINKASRIAGQVGAYAANTLVSASGEAAIEAVNAFNEEAKLLKGNSELRFALLEQSLDPRDPQYYDKLDRIRAAKENYDLEIDSQLRDMGNSIFGANIGILSLTNSLEFYRILRGGYKNASKLMAHSIKSDGANIENKDLLKTILKGLKVEVTNEVNKGAGRIAFNTFKNAASEGFEEGAQNIASNSNQMWTALKLNDVADLYKYDSGDSLFRSRMNPEVKEGIHSYMEALSQTWKDQFGGFEKPGWEEVFLGALTGALGFANISRKDVKDKDGNNVIDNHGNKKLRFSITWDGGVVLAIKEAKEDYNENQRIVDKLNERLNSQEFKDRLLHLTSKMDFENQLTEALANNDAYQFKNSEIGEIINDALYYRSIGQIDLYKLLIGGLRNIDDATLELIYVASMDNKGETALSKDEIENIRKEYQTQALQNILAIDKVLDTFDLVDESNRDLPQIAKEELVYKYVRLDDVNKRINELEQESLKENLVNLNQNNGKNLSKEQELDLEKLKKDKERLEKEIKFAEKNPGMFTFSVLATLSDLEERELSKSADHVVKKLDEAESVIQIHDVMARAVKDIAWLTYDLVKNKSDHKKRNLLDEWAKGNTARISFFNEIDQSNYDDETKEKLKEAFWNLFMSEDSELELERGKELMKKVSENVEDYFNLDAIFGEARTDKLKEKRNDDIKFLQDAAMLANDYLNKADMEHKDWQRRELVRLEQENKRKEQEIKQQRQGPKQQAKANEAKQLQLQLLKLKLAEKKKEEPQKTQKQEEGTVPEERKLVKDGIVKQVYNKIGEKFKEKEPYINNPNATGEDFEKLIGGIKQKFEEIVPEDARNKMHEEKGLFSQEKWIALLAKQTELILSGLQTADNLKNVIRQNLASQAELFDIIKGSQDEIEKEASRLSEELVNSVNDFYSKWKEEINNRQSSTGKEGNSNTPKGSTQDKPKGKGVGQIPQDKSKSQNSKDIRFDDDENSSKNPSDTDEWNIVNTPVNTLSLSENRLSPLEDQKAISAMDRMYGNTSNASRIQFAVDNVLNDYMPLDKKLSIIAQKAYIRGEKDALTSLYLAIPVTDKMSQELLSKCLVLKTANGDYVAVGSLFYKGEKDVKAKTMFDKSKSQLEKQDIDNDDFEYVVDETNNLYVKRIGNGRIIDQVEGNVPGFSDMAQRQNDILGMLSSPFQNPKGLKLEDLTFMIMKDDGPVYVGNRKNYSSKQYSQDEVEKRKGNIYVLIPRSDGGFFAHKISNPRFDLHMPSNTPFRERIDSILKQLSDAKQDGNKTKAYGAFMDLRDIFVNATVDAYFDKDNGGDMIFKVQGNRYTLSQLDIDEVLSALMTGRNGDGTLISITEEILENPQQIKELNDSGLLNVLSAYMLGTYGATVVVTDEAPQKGDNLNPNKGKQKTPSNIIAPIGNGKLLIFNTLNGKWYLKKDNGDLVEETDRDDINKANAIKSCLDNQNKKDRKGFYKLDKYKGANQKFNGEYYIYGDLTSDDDDIIVIKKIYNSWKIISNKEMREAALNSIRKQAKVAGKQSKIVKAVSKEDKKQGKQEKEKGQKETPKEDNDKGVRKDEEKKGQPYRPRRLDGLNTRRKDVSSKSIDKKATEILSSKIDKLDETEKQRIKKDIGDKLGKDPKSVTNEDIWEHIKNTKAINRQPEEGDLEKVIDNYINCG